MDEPININTTHEQKIIQCIKDNAIFNFKDIFVFYKAISRATAYNHNLDKLDSIKEALHDNRRTGVTTLIDKWINSDNPTLQIAAFKQLCDDDERQKLNQQYIDHTSKGKEFNIIHLGNGTPPDEITP